MRLYHGFDIQITRQSAGRPAILFAILVSIVQAPAYSVLLLYSLIGCLTSSIIIVTHDYIDVGRLIYRELST